MVKRGLIYSAFTILPKQLQPASLDLRLGEVAVRVQCSFLPGKETVKEKLAKYESHRLDLVKGAVLEPGAVYIVPLMEELRLHQGLRAKANPRSSTGRLVVRDRAAAVLGLGARTFYQERQSVRPDCQDGVGCLLRFIVSQDGPLTQLFALVLRLPFVRPNCWRNNQKQGAQ